MKYLQDYGSDAYIETGPLPPHKYTTEVFLPQIYEGP
jgi:hypothetical protein